jgi:hypothetical protein
MPSLAIAGNCSCISGIHAIPGDKIKAGIPGRPQAGPIFFRYRRRVSKKQGEIDALEIDAPELSLRSHVAGRCFFVAAVRRIAAAATPD